MEILLGPVGLQERRSEGFFRLMGEFLPGPREICIVRKSAIPLLFSPQSKCGKSTFYAQAQTESKYCNVNQSRDHDDHRRRRKAWDRGFSVKGEGNSFILLLSYDPTY
jgi:hypothetical protein